jgi:hypothetical protein
MMRRHFAAQLEDLKKVNMAAGARPSPSPSPARAAGSGAPLRVLLHSHSWSHCDGVAIRYQAHARQLRKEGHWVGLSLSAAESEGLAACLPARLLPGDVPDGAAETSLLSLPDAARVPCSDGPMMPMGSLRNFAAALAFVVRQRPDVIHATFDSHAVSWLLVARLAGKPLCARTCSSFLRLRRLRVQPCRLLCASDRPSLPLAG